MKNLYNYEEFVKENKLNEGFFDFLNKIFTKLNTYAKKVKDSNEIDKLVTAAKKEITATAQKQITNLADQYIKTLGAKKGVGEENVGATKELVGESVLNEAETKQNTVKQNDLNPVQKYINQFLDIQRKKMAPYINSSNDATKHYATAKLGEIEETILKMEMDAFQKVNDQNLKNKLNQHIKDVQKNIENEVKELEKVTAEKNKKKNKDVVKGQINGYYMYHSETDNKDINVELIEDQNNIKDAQKKKENEENKDNEAEKWVKLKSDKSDFYVRKGELKKIQKPTE